HEMGDRRALIAADIAHARLKQRLGDGEYALALENLALSLAQKRDFAGEGSFHAASRSLARDDGGIAWTGQHRPDADRARIDSENHSNYVRRLHISLVSGRAFGRFVGAPASRGAERAFCRCGGPPLA